MTAGRVWPSSSAGQSRTVAEKTDRRIFATLAMRGREKTTCPFYRAAAPRSTSCKTVRLCSSRLIDDLQTFGREHRVEAPAAKAFQIERHVLEPGFLEHLDHLLPERLFGEA